MRWVAGWGGRGGGVGAISGGFGYMTGKNDMGFFFQYYFVHIYYNLPFYFVVCIVWFHLCLKLFL